MAWSIVEVARMARVTSRTLRHYDDVGLLLPAYVGSNGYRYYEQEQLLRLQEILLLRELGLGLETISEVLAGERDRAEALRRHEEWLRGEQQRLVRLADTVARTITSLEGGHEMTAPEMFEGFADRQAQAEETLVARFGEQVRESFATARHRTKDWTEQDYLSEQQRWEQVEARLLQLLQDGAEPGSPAVLDAVDDHYRLVCRHWTPDRESYTGLGQMYVEDPQFRARYDALDPALAEYLRDALAAYATARLT